MPQLKTLIFDVDGTLVDTEEVHRQAFNLAFLDFDLGWQWTPHLYSELLAISGGRERIHSYAIHLGQCVKKTNDFNEFVLRVHQRKSAHYARLISSAEVPLRPGIKRLLNEALEQNVKLAIATSTSMVNVK
ncbi:MAG: HAD hydrolase-like protein, partial [Anaerolineae bacterium]|nr:HAD hydrolase-like protein [Anaerolineae bacterium]